MAQDMLHQFLSGSSAPEESSYTANINMATTTHNFLVDCRMQTSFLEPGSTQQLVINTCWEKSLIYLNFEFLLSKVFYFLHHIKTVSVVIV